MNRMPSKEQVEYIRERYPAGTRVILHAMGDPQAPPPRNRRNGGLCG